MKKFIFSLIVLSFCAVNSGNAQFKKIQSTRTPVKKETSTETGTKNSNNSGTSTSTSVKKDTAIVRPSKRFDTTRESNGREYGGVVPNSKRISFGYQPEPTSDRKPLAWDHIREDDATYSQFVWRDIDGREKINMPFIYSAKEDNGDQRFFSILLNAVKNDGVVAFSAEDDRFTTPLTYNEVLSMSSSKSAVLDTTFAENPNDENVQDTVIRWKENLKAPKPDSIYKFRIKEQWMFDKESSRMLVRIIGIAPLAPNPLPPGVKKQTGPTTYYPVFWVYYPDLRASLAKHFAYNPKNMGARMTWEEVFEGRFFSSAIYKSTLNNPGDKTLAQLIKDPLFQLLEGENIKEKLFNYEQDLWSY